jgi:hypothetical protein
VRNAGASDVGAPMEIKVGSRLRSVVCETEVIVVKSPGRDVDLRCGGHPMVAKDDAAAGSGAPSEGKAGGALIGKRYGDDGLGVELLVTKGGSGTLAIGETPLPVKEAKRLPSSD